MNVAIVSRHFPGGIGTAAWHQASMMARRGHRVFLVSASGPIAGFCARAGITFVPVHRRKLTCRTLLWSLLLRMPALSRRRNILPSDVENLGFAARERSVVRGLVKSKRIEAVFFSDSFVEAAHWRAPAGCRTVMGFHGPQYQYHWLLPERPMEVNRGLLRLDVRAARRADLWYAPSRYMRGLAAGYYGIPEERIEVIPNAVDAREFSPREGRPAHRDILFAGRFTVEKGADVLVEVLPSLLAEFDDLTFTIAGDSGPDKANRPLAEVLLERAGPAAGRVRWRRMLPYDALPGLYGETSVLALPSRYDNFPMVCLEAHSSGVPVVASKVGGIPEIVDHGSTGLLVPPGDPQAAREALRRLLRNPDERAAMGRAARERALRLWSFDAVGPKLEAFLKSDPGSRASP